MWKRLPDVNKQEMSELRRFEVRGQDALGRRLRVEAMLQKLPGWPGVLDFLLRQMCGSERLAHFGSEHTLVTGAIR